MMRQQTVAPLFAERSFVSPETYDAFFSLMARLEVVIERETEMLRAHRHDGLTESTRQKRQGLLELNRMLRSMENTIPSQDIISRLADFRKRLASNDAALKIELRAAQEVNAIIVRVMRDMESDGTYSRAFGRADYDLE